MPHYYYYKNSFELIRDSLKGSWVPSGNPRYSLRVQTLLREPRITSRKVTGQLQRKPGHVGEVFQEDQVLADWEN